MQHAVEEEVVALEHVEVVHAIVVLAGGEVGEPAAEVVVVVRDGAELLLSPGLDSSTSRLDAGPRRLDA